MEDTPESVARGVKEAISRNLNPADVRARVLEKMNQHRARLIEIVQEYLNKRSRQVAFAEVFHRHFINKLLVVKPMSELKMFPARR